jgi:hypothetical protein
MSVYKISVSSLESLSTNLTTVANEFDNANTNSDSIANNVGHSGLENTVRDFAHKWDDTREDMVEAVRSLADGAGAVAAGWSDFDLQGAQALTESDSGATTPSAH